MPYVPEDGTGNDLYRSALDLCGYEAHIPGSELFFFEWGKALGKEILPLINALSKICGDDVTYLADIDLLRDTHGLAFFVQSYKRYPLLRFQAPIQEAVFLQDLKETRPIEYVSRHIHLAPPLRNYDMAMSQHYLYFASKKGWRIYSESDYELGVLETTVAFPKGIAYPKLLQAKTRDDAFDECRPLF